jgi:alkanesulfonate monooxygenase SsuD/methylene tetrahydromethanopterin reductase-like flavin-dependent oxidoreductase (luciferase family)
VAVSAICAESAEEAQYLAASWRAAFAMMRLGRLIPVPPPEKGLRILGELGIDPATPPHRRRAVVGDPVTVREGIEAVAAEYGADEVLVVTITYEHAKRRRSYELIAEAFGPVPRAGG